MHLRLNSSYHFSNLLLLRHKRKKRIFRFRIYNFHEQWNLTSDQARSRSRGLSSKAGPAAADAAAAGRGDGARVALQYEPLPPAAPLRSQPCGPALVARRSWTLADLPGAGAAHLDEDGDACWSGIDRFSPKCFNSLAIILRPEADFGKAEVFGGNDLTICHSGGTDPIFGHFPCVRYRTWWFVLLIIRNCFYQSFTQLPISWWIAELLLLRT